MEAASPAGSPLTDEWCAHHFNYLAPEFAREIHPTLARMRARCPVTHSDERGGFWVVTRYEDVLRVAQDWETFSSELGVAIPDTKMVVPAIPEHIDPPLHRAYKRLISAWFTPAVVRPYEEPTRALVTRLIDEFVEAGRCDFMTDFAQPFPGLAFFDLVLNAPPEQVREVADLAQRASVPTNPDSRECWQALNAWITGFVAQRRAQPPQGDVVDAILAAEIDGRPVTETEVLGLILLLILGGLETTAGALGQFMLRFVREPEIPALLRDRPELVPAAVEELLRLEDPFLAIGRTVRHDTEIDGHPIRAGEKVLISWASANRDEDEFPDPDAFDLDRARNRHIAFGAGPHRCAGSNLARLNLRVAVHELVQRLDGIELLAPEDSLPFHTAFNRSPLALPIAFSPGPRTGGPAAPR
ncbi:MAG TPA: cytochrome P450 [Acidimicrobiales bacterium]|nr:cytochrome P450 [Acidimicrobiales bacterium]